MYNVQCTKEDIASEIHVYNAVDSVDELKEIARRMRWLAAQGMRYRDMALVRTEVNAGQVKRIFGEFDIPYYVDTKLDLVRHPLAAYLCAVLEFCEARGYREALAVVRSAYFVGGNTDAFVTHCIANSIDYGGFDNIWNEHEDIRKKLADVIAKLPKGNAAAKDWAAACLELIEGTEDATTELGLRAGVDYSGVTDRIRRSIEFAGDAYGAGKLSAGEFAEVLQLLLDGAELSPLSPSADCVIIGELSAFRGSAYRACFVSNFNDGVLPKTEEDGGVITDAEIEVLLKGGIKLEPSIKEVNRRAKTELKQLLAGGHGALYLSWTAEGDGKKSAYLEHIEQNFEVQKLHRDLGYSASARTNCEHELITFAAGGKSVLEHYYYDAIYGALKFNPDKYLPKNIDFDYRLKNADNLFFPSKRTKVTQLEKYFACPFRHFAEYGLRLKERQTGKILPIDAGNILHGAIEKLAGRPDIKDLQKEVNRVVAEILADYPPTVLEANEGFISRLKQECVRVLEIIAYQDRQSKFKNHGKEVKFDGLKLGGIEVTGVIDRVDMYEDAVRIIDYKSGKVDTLKANDLHFGQRLQLYIYMTALMREGKKAAGIFYFPLKDEFGEAGGDYRMTGLFSKSYAVAMDNNLGLPEYTSDIVRAKTTKKGEISGVSKSALNEGELEKMCGYAAELAAAGVGEIADGYISPSPFESACDICKCGDICGVKDVYQRTAKSN